MLAPAAILVAVVASRGAVHEITHAVVLVDRLRLLVRSGGVAIDTRKTGVVRGNLVAIVANRAVMRNREVGVVKGSAEPACGCMAGIASRWVARRDVIGHRAAEGLRAVPLSNVASVASCICRGERIVVVDVAIGAGLHAAYCRYDVTSGQCPARGAVIKFAVGP